MKPRRLAAGFGIVGAMFVVVVLAGIAITVSYLGSQQHFSGALDERGARAYQAAKSGVEWGVYTVRIQGNYGGCFAAANFGFPASAASLQDFGVTVECRATADNNNYLIRATACAPVAAAGNLCPNGAPPLTYVERQVTASIGH